MRGFSTFAVLAALLLAGCGGGSSEADQPAAAAGYRFVQVASGFQSPVHVTAPRNQRGRVYVVEQEGRIRIVRNGRITGTFLDIRSQVMCCGEQGLLSVAFHPRFARNGKYYVNYTDNGGDSRVVEYRGRRRLRQLMFWDDPYSNHNGGQNAFGPDGRLYVGMGDGGAGGDPENRAQNLRSPFGKLFALNVDRRGARPQIVGYGLRNPWRFSFDRATGDLYIGDVGQNSWEEVDFTPRRSPGLENYGWDVYEGRQRFEEKAVSGGFVYRGKAVPAAKGRYFYGDNCSGTVWSFPRGRARSVRQEPFSLGGLSSFGEDAAGELYAVTLNGRLYQLRSG